MLSLATLGMPARSDAQLHGMYLAQTTLIEGDAPAVLVSSAVATTTITVSDRRTSAVVSTTSVPASAQASSSEPWNGVGWSRATPLPPPPPGIHRVAMPVAHVDPAQAKVDGRWPTTETLLLVRPSVPASRGPVLIVVDTHNWQAYNAYGGRSTYTAPYAITVSRDRPGFLPSHADAATLIAKTLDRLGVAWEVADVEWVEAHPGVLQHYRLVVVPGQQEYTTRNFREQIEAYFEQGGRVAFFGAELFYYQVRMDGPRMTVYKWPSRGPDPILLDGDDDNDELATYEWSRVGSPESELLGTSVWLAGQIGSASAWTAHRTDHWLWRGSGLLEGDVLAQAAPTDFFDGTFVAWAGGLPWPTARDLTRTPDDVLVLGTIATAGAQPFWCWLAGSGASACTQPGTGTIAIRQNDEGGIFFVLPHNAWPSAWMESLHPTVRSVTENALRVLASASPVDAYDGYAVDDDADGDGDGVPDAEDVCPFAFDPAQQDTGGLGAGSAPDGIGDACQCGDVSGDGRVTTADAVLLSRSLLQPPSVVLPAPDRCDVGAGTGCTTADAVIVRRALLSPPTARVAQACPPSRRGGGV